MAIWKRIYKEDRVYFNLDPALIQRQDTELTIRFFGIPLLTRRIDFNAGVIEKQQAVGFKHK